ncbi:MAG: F0F1 ATP synthase subunit B [Phycisphaerales bacterium]
MLRIRQILALTTPVLFATAALAAPEASHGAEGDHAASTSTVMDFSLLQYGSAILAFLLVYGVLAKVAWPKISKGLTDRENKIRSEIRAAEEARKQAGESLKQYEKSLAEARAEAQAILERTRADQQKFAAELRAKADAELSGLRERAMRDIESARREAMNDIYNQAVTLASEIAGKILKREVSPADHARLLEESIGELESANR